MVLATNLVITSPSQLPYYSGDTLTVNCVGPEASELPHIILTITTAAWDDALVIGCKNGPTGWTQVHIQNLALTDKFSTDCSNIERDNNMMMISVTGSIETSMSQYLMRCGQFGMTIPSYSSETTLPDEIRGRLLYEIYSLLQNVGNELTK